MNRHEITDTKIAARQERYSGTSDERDMRRSRANTGGRNLSWATQIIWGEEGEREEGRKIERETEEEEGETEREREEGEMRK